MFAITLFNMLASDEKIEQQKQSAILIDQSATNAPLKPELITELVLSPPDSIAYAEYAIVLPTSLRNTPMPEHLDINDDGSLIINKKILHLFEFYLSAMGEESIEVIITRIKSSLREQLTAQALDEALHILEGYLQYRNEITALKQAYNQAIGANDYSLEHVINARDELIEARWRFLSKDVIAAFFAQEDDYENYMLGIASITKDNSLSKEQKDNAISLLNTQAPSWLIEQQKSANQLNEYRQHHSELISQGASEDEIRALREQEFSIDASDRLSTLDAQRLLWQQRLSEYRVELATILAIEPDRQAQQAMVDELRSRHFNAQETRRVNALDSSYL
jgi:lipase chaperone LimK